MDVFVRDRSVEYQVAMRDLARIDAITEKCRTTARVSRDNMEFARLSSETLEALLADGPTLNTSFSRAVFASLEAYRDNADRRRYIAWTRTPSLGFCWGFIDSPTAPELRLEWILYRPLQLKEKIVGAMSSMALPVFVLAHSNGFSNRRTVAVFPEDFAFRDGPLVGSSETPAIYFIDRFIRRSVDTTLKLLFSTTTDDSLRELKAYIRSLPAERLDSEVANLCGAWMWFHETHHRLGHMPLDLFLACKSGRFAGALEELRADTGAMVSLLSSEGADNDAVILCQFILAERVLRYPVSCLMSGKKLDYDAIGSHVLLNWMERHGAVCRSHGQLQFSANCFDSVVNFNATVSDLERKVAEDFKRDRQTTEASSDNEEFASAHARNKFADFVRANTGFTSTIDLPPDPFYVGASQTLLAKSIPT
jgi:hypothetical protein